MAKSKKSSKSAAKKKPNPGTAVKTAEKPSALKQAEAKAEQIVNAKEKTEKNGKSGAKKPNAAAKFFRELKSELKKVVWPSKKTVLNNTGVVLAVMCISALVVAGIDSVFTAALKAITELAG